MGVNEFGLMLYCKFSVMYWNSKFNFYRVYYIYERGVYANTKSSKQQF